MLPLAVIEPDPVEVEEVEEEIQAEAAEEVLAPPPGGCRSGSGCVRPCAFIFFILSLNVVSVFPST